MGKKEKSLNPKKWTGRMKDIPVFLLGNAPSINKTKLSLLDDYFTIGINRIFYKYDPTILIWQDLALWIQEKKRVIKTKAIKYCRQGADTRGGFYTFKLTGKDPHMPQTVETLYGRGSSGSITYQFAFALGCNPIILVGMDCTLDNKGNTDFYGKNPMHRSHTMPYCKKGLKFIKKNSRDRKIINCSKNKVFPNRYKLKEAISMIGSKKYTREGLEKKLLNG